MTRRKTLIVILALVTLVGWSVYAYWPSSPDDIEIIGAIDKRNAAALALRHREFCFEIGKEELKNSISAKKPAAAIECLRYWTSRGRIQVKVESNAVIVTQFYSKRTPAGDSISNTYRKNAEGWAE